MRCNIDSRNRLVDMLRVSVTDRCNLRCIYCMPKDGIMLHRQEEILTFEEITKFIEAAAELGINKIKLTGGEPLVRAGIVALVEMISKIKEVKEISMTTNGLLLKGYAQRLKASGLRRINISLDTLKEDKFRTITRGGSLNPALACKSGVNDVLDGIDEALRAGFAIVKINVVVMKGVNDDEILDFAGLAKEKPLTVRFIELMPFSANMSHYSQRFIPACEIMSRCQSLGELLPIDEKLGSGPAKYFKVKGYIGSLGFITPMTHPFCSACNKLRITADGKLKSCLFSDGNLDVKSMLRSGAGKEKLQELIARALAAKPEKGMIFESYQRACGVAMSQIGG